MSSVKPEVKGEFFLLTNIVKLHHICYCKLSYISTVVILNQIGMFS